MDDDIENEAKRDIKKASLKKAVAANTTTRGNSVCKTA